MTDKKIIPVAPQPVKPTSSFPIRHKENVTQITTIIPKNTKIDGELEDSPITAGIPGEENEATMVLTNTGNALSDYSLTTSGLPGWVVNFTPNAVTALAPEVGTWPTETGCGSFGH